MFPVLILALQLVQVPAQAPPLVEAPDPDATSEHNLPSAGTDAPVPPVLADDTASASAVEAVVEESPESAPAQSEPASMPVLPSPVPAPQPVASPAPKPIPPPAVARTCKIAVLDLKAGDGFTEKGVEALTDALATEIGQRSKCEVMSRADIRSMISFEAEKQLLGCGEESCLAELGGALGVDFLVTGSVSKMGESTLLSLKKINLVDLKVVRRVTDTFNGIDDEVVFFTQWMARRLEMGDATAGQKPIPRPKQVVSQGDPNKVKYVEKHMTLWRGLAWTSAALTGVAGLVTLGAVGGTYGMSWVLMQEKTRPASDNGGTDAGTVSTSTAVGPYLATAANVGMYATGALFVATVVLFFLPSEEFEVRELQAPAGSGGEVQP
ncbi:MAG: hypothetical protein ABIJ09_15170 [Pseudomonadota bacterium]